MERARLAVLRLLPLLARLPLPLLPLPPVLRRALLDRLEPERLLVERDDRLPPDELPELEPLLLAWGITFLLV